MNKLTIFKNAEFGELTVLMINDEPWFIGKEVASILGYKDTKSAVRDLIDEDDKLHLTYNELLNIFRGGEFPPLKINNNGMIVINESGFYSLVLGSKLETAKKFKKWVTSEVLPSIRKTGSYTIKKEIYELDQASYLIKDQIARAEAWLAEQKRYLNVVEEKKLLSVKNYELTKEISALQSIARMYGDGVGIKLTSISEHPEYSTTSMRTMYTEYKYKYWYYTIKVLSLYYGYELYAVPDRSLKKQVIYPNKIFELYEKYTDKYWSELSSDGEDWDIKNVPLAKFIIDKVTEDGLESIYRLI